MTVLALDIGGTKLAAALVNDAGELHGYRAEATGQDAAAALDRVIALGRELRDDSVTAVGVSTMGITRPDRVLIAPTVPGWATLRIPERVAAAFGGLPASIVNDVKAATLAEMAWGELRNVRDGLYLNLGTGVAAGVVSGGALVGGAHGAAGEFGYVVPTVLELGLTGDSAVGESGPVEQRIGGRGAAEAASAELGEPVSVADLFRRAPDEPRVRVLLDRLLDEIGLWAGNLATITDPSVIVLGGGLMRSAEPVLDRVRQLVRKIAPFPPAVTVARFRASAALAGAGAAALGHGAPRSEAPGTGSGAPR
jgi:glucokinase